ncbi:uncharacterized protein LOC113324549 [Papaver somniferum]|uniref:uncharacterized protein LOC113324549 n=1 Tax=Papaver somniferum TaxID=3469 RepID=UPI000E6FFDB3|nr:uncharacterized protein LOC113324549 [Papaver somniferum]
MSQLLLSPNTLPNYTFQDGVLRYKNKLYIGEGSDVRAKLLHSLHDYAIGGHSGIQATSVRATSHFYWTCMHRDIVSFVSQGDVCQRNKADHTNSADLLQPLPIHEHAWQHITMDFIEGFPVSNMKSIILVIVDRLTKYAHFLALQHPYTAASVAHAFLNQVVKLHGLPSSIVSDRDKVFTSNFWYVPPHLAFPSATTTSVAAVETYLNERASLLDIFKEPLHKAQERMKLYADRSGTDRTFEVGDLVYLKLQPYIQSSLSLRKNFKLSSKYYGPFPVLQHIGKVSYKLELPSHSRIHPVFHVSHLKKHIGQKHTPAPSLPVVDHEGQIIMLPENTLGTRSILQGDRVVKQELIQWTNSFPENFTWEDLSNIRTHFPKFILEDRDFFQGEVMSQCA